MTGLDPCRNKPLVDWIMNLQLDFHSDSVFASTSRETISCRFLFIFLLVNKSLSLFTDLVGAMGIRFGAAADKYINLLFDNFDIGYDEVGSHLQYRL